jgi:4-amino-4-deoxy-L-arabinose transferase-like glycosyltransferase
MKRTELILLLLILSSGLILRLADLNAPVSYDEAYTYIAFARQNWFGIWSDYSLPNNHILHSLLIKLSTGLFGNHPASLRLPAFLAGLAAIPLIYLLAKRLYTPTVALLTAALVAWLPALIHYDTAARGYSLVSLFTLLAWLFGVLALQTNRLWHWLGLALSLTLGFFTIPTMLFPAGGLYLWLLGEGLLRREKRKEFYFGLFGSGALVVVFSLALYSPVLLISGWRKLIANGFVQPVEPQLYFSKVLWEQLSATWSLWNQDILPALGLALTLGLVLSLVFFKQNATTRLHLAVPMGLWLILYIFLRRPNAYDRFWAFLLAPAMLWAAAGLIETANRLRVGRFRAGDVLSGLALAALVLFSAAGAVSIPEKWTKMSNIEALALELQPALRPGDMVLTGYPNDAPLWYYLARLGVDDSAWQVRAGFERAFVLVSTYSEQTPETVIRASKLDLALFDLSTATKLGQVGLIEAYLINPR